MSRYDEVLLEAMETSSKERSEQFKKNAACGYLAQWVVQLERDLKETKEHLEIEKKRRIAGLSVEEADELKAGINALNESEVV